ncbi:hypothetical protein ACJMK2_000481 [Sinanodonta woodiana]|uniref:TGF-beta family profile domain-containing protein n=1 Tax=Sinanodonta woodiana TaxID=1069815 RepID=A0ABD3XSY2_SINWO
MQQVESLTWIIISSLMFMSHLYKEISCESIVRKIENGLEQIFDEKHILDMTTDDSKPGTLSTGPFKKVHSPDQDTTSVKSEHVGDDDPGRKQNFMGDLFQTSKEDFLRDDPTTRKRRHSASQQPTGSQCQRHPMYVDFKTLGWDTWITAPSGYDAYYCAGECPLQLANFNSTRHAQIQGFMSVTNPEIPKPCCVPTKLSSRQLIFTANSTVYNEHWTEMIVEACGCL